MGKLNITEAPGPEDFAVSIAKGSVADPCPVRIMGENGKIMMVAITSMTATPAFSDYRSIVTFYEVQGDDEGDQDPDLRSAFTFKGFVVGSNGFEQKNQVEGRVILLDGIHRGQMETMYVNDEIGE